MSPPVEELAIETEFHVRMHESESTPVVDPLPLDTINEVMRQMQTHDESMHAPRGK